MIRRVFAHHFSYGQGWRDLAIIALGVLLVWKLISASLEPNLVLAERTDKDVYRAQVVAQSTENAYLRSQLYRTPTPGRICPSPSNC